MAEDYQENYITGWIKLYRSFISWEWFEVPNMVTVFIYCLLKANHKDKSWRGIEIKKGSFITSYETMSKETNLSIQSIRTCLKHLEKTKEINKQSNKQNTLITICKYGTYQQFEEDANIQTNKRLTNNQQTANKQPTTTNNDNNIKNEKKDSKYTETQFLKDWNTTRTEILKKPSHLNRLSFDVKQCFNELKTDSETTVNALKGFFKQRSFPRGQDYTVNVKHFLNHFDIYLQAYHDKNPLVWGNENNGKT